MIFSGNCPILNLQGCKKIIFTRDFHPQNHCSFGSSDPAAFSPISGHEGKFPQHCVYNTPGADITPAIKTKIVYEDGAFKWGTHEVEILFKGHHATGDSFGAAPYPTDSTDSNDTKYLTQRQNKNRDTRGPGDYANRNNITNSCCTGANCNTLTGGFKLTDANYAKSNDMVVIDQNEDKENAFTNMVVPYPLEETMPDNDGQVYVIGLAGEFCVKDTAINLKKYFTKQNKPYIKVNVIQDLTRYVFVPIFLSFQRYTMDGALVPFGPWKNPENEYRLSDAVFENKPYKPLSLYLFEYGGANPTATKRLNLTDSEKTIIANDGTTIDKNTDISFPTSENPGAGLKYWHFTMNQNELIRDYALNGINLCISQSQDNII